MYCLRVLISFSEKKEALIFSNLLKVILNVSKLQNPTSKAKNKKLLFYFLYIVKIHKVNLNHNL